LNESKKQHLLINKAEGSTQTFCEFLEGNDWIPPPLMIGCA
jgi:hypothetical protein